MSRHTPITVLSGIPPGDSGTGRMIRQLVDQAKNSGLDINFVSRQRPASIRRLLKAGKVLSAASVLLETAYQNIRFSLHCRRLLASRKGKLLLMHPQTLGFELTNRLLEIWPAGKAFIYILDSSYFCVRSYNYIPGETAPCLRCLGGKFEARAQHGCTPFPVKDALAAAYTQVLYKATTEKRVNFLSQNDTQKRFAKTHFGPDTPVEVVGLWGQEWTEPFDDFEADEQSDGSKTLERLGLDAEKPTFVIHSFFVPAKGADWFLAVSKLCPQYQFVCPFPKPHALQDDYPNVLFHPLTWESGLRDLLGAATATFVPSLWSTPIEGAMVKSIVASQRVAVVQNHSSHQLELPDGLVLRLSGSPQEAAPQLAAALAANWETDATIKRDWVREFRQKNEGFATNLLEAVADSE